MSAVYLVLEVSYGQWFWAALLLFLGRCHILEELPARPETLSWQRALRHNGGPREPDSDKGPIGECAQFYEAKEEPASREHEASENLNA